MRTLLIAVLALIASTVAQTTIPPRRAQLCAFSQSSNAIYKSFAARYYAGLFPNTHFDLRLLNSQTNLRGLVAGLIANGTGCDSLAMTSSSTNALAVSPLVPASIAWVENSATSNELSNKAAHPTFNRVIPTDKVGAGGAALFAIQQGWTVANVLCVDIAYGRSVSEGFTARFQELGGQIEYSRCIQSSASAEDIAVAIEPIIERSTSRVIFFAGSLMAMPTFQALGATTKLIWLFSEASCSATSSLLQYLPGAFCANYATSEQYPAFVAAYQARDIDPDQQYNWVLSQTAITDRSARLGTYAAMVGDATRLQMMAIDGYPAANKTMYPSLAQFTRSLSFQGLTGLVSLDANGDRIEATMRYFNVQPNPSNTSELVLVSLGTIANGTLQPGDPTQPVYYGLDHLGWLATPPSALKPVPVKASAKPLWVIAIVAAILVIVALASVQYLRQRQLRANCPLDGNVPFTVMFVSVKNEARMREVHPDTCATAFTALATMVRSAARRHGCHEARRVNETTFMLVSKRPEQAIGAAAELQRAACARPWERVLRANGNNANGSTQNGAARTRSGHADPNTRSQTLERSGTLARSRDTMRSARSNTSTVRTATRDPAANARKTVAPQLNIGIHTGLGEIDHDEELGVLSYHGAVVDRAAYVADAAVGGHIVVTEGTLEMLPEAEGLRPLGALSPFREVTIPSGSAAVKKSEQASLMLHTFMPAGMPQEDAINNRIDKALTAQAHDDATGGVAAAMSAADTGVSRRRVAVVCFHVPALLNPDNLTDAAQAKRLRTIVREVCGVAAEHKGAVQSVTDGRITVTVNASGPHVSQPEARAAHIAHRVVVDLADALLPFHGVTAGVATGRSMEGLVEGLPASVGAVNATARAMQLAAAGLGVACVANDASYDDLCANFRCVTVDAVALGGRITRVVAVLEPRDGTADGEWLYQMEDQASFGRSGASLGVSEARWVALLRGDSVAPATKQEEAALPPNDDCDDDSGAPRCAALAQLHFQHVIDAPGGVASYAEQRSRELYLTL